jgi:O-antigen/teichoic acid export membrane protein
LMVTLTTSSQLGLYAVAVSLAGVSNVFSSTLGIALLPRITRGETAVVARASSITLTISVVLNIGLAAACPVVLPLLFGANFRDAVPMVWILAAAAVPNTGTQVLTASLIGAGRPRFVALSELTAVGITVGGLLFLVGPLGGIGAALVSLAAYSITFVIMAVGSMREFRLPLRRLIVPTRRDLLAQGVLVRSLITRIMQRHSGASAA